MEELYPIGLGTARFPFNSPETYSEDFENAVDLVLYALERGINYIDVGEGYSNGQAMAVLKEAFRRTSKDYHTTIKINCYNEKFTAEDYYKKALDILDKLGVEKTTYFLLWTLIDSKQFHHAIEKDSLYEAALRLKREGKIDHIGTSVHMKYDEIKEVIESGLFEFVLVSYHLLNFIDMQPVLDCALEHNVDILVMNPLYGGLIPQSEELFKYAKTEDDKTVTQAAIRAVLAHPAVKCVLAGASNKEQLDGYLSAVTETFSEDERNKRLQWLRKNIHDSGTFCSYCRYCIDCPKKIRVPELMNASNIFSLQKGKIEGAAVKAFFRLLHEKFNVDFESGENPCVKCGRCEKRCTQHLNIINTIQGIYDLVAETQYDMASRKRRFEELLGNGQYKRVGFWPASLGTKKILDIYRKVCGEPRFEVYLFDTNTEFRGKERMGYIVRGKEDIIPLNVDCILITSYNYRKNIHEQLLDIQEKGVEVKELYREGDMDWWW